MTYNYKLVTGTVHRLIPSRFPPVALFDWAESAEELEQIAILEGMTSERLKTEYGEIAQVAKEDWVGGPGATPLMAAFTYLGESRFSDGSYGVYYAGDSLETAIAKTRFHRERFLRASNEAPCLVQMREYISNVKNKLVDITAKKYSHLCSPNLDTYPACQLFGKEVKLNNEYGIFYYSARNPEAKCVAVFRPPALTIPVQGCHLDYIWDGNAISEVRKSVPIPTPTSPAS